MGIYETIQDAHVSLTNSGVYEWFDWEQIEGGYNSPVVHWMFENQATPEQAAEHFGVE